MIAAGKFLVSVFAAAFMVAEVRAVDTSPFVAFSLGAAEQRIKLTGSDAEATMLGGITRPLGVVIDPEHHDLIFVGQAVAGERPLSLDDFVVALRSRLLYKQWPLVSIDKTPQTESTGKQAVRFEGGIGNTRLGKDLLDADVVLKRLSLGDLPTDVWGFPSYFAMAADRATKSPQEHKVSTRFWFTPPESSVAVRPGVAVINELHIAVQAEVMADISHVPEGDDPAALRNEVGDKFAASMTASYEDLSVAYPEVGRVKTLLGLVAVAHGVENLGERPNLDFWLKQYRVADVATPKEYDLLKREASIPQTDRVFVLEISGGVELKAKLERLDEEGDITAIRDLVIMSRPEGNAIVWKVPLGNWQMPGYAERSAEASPAAGTTQIAEGKKIGCIMTERFYLQGQSRPINPPSVALPPVQPFGNQGPRANPSDFLFPITSQPVPRPQSRIGGVMLSGTARIEGEHGGPATATVDLSGGNFSLIVDGKNARIAPAAYRKFITALWCVYYSDQDPGISIDPIAPNVEKHLVRYIGRVVNTDLGRVMREADYRMKKWAVGTEKPDFPGFQDVDALAARVGRTSAGVSRRFWFVPEDMTFKQGGDLLLFDRGRMRIKTEYIDQAAFNGAAPADQAFADFFTAHYDALAEKYPVYKELFEYAKLVALAKYLKQQGVPLQWFLLAHKDLVLTEDSPGTVDQLSKESEYFSDITIMGGVDLKTEGHYVYDQQAVAAIQTAMKDMPAAPVHATDLAGGPTLVCRAPREFSFDAGSQSYSVLPQHTMTSGKDYRGIRYQTDFALRQNGHPGLELVRYYSPRNCEEGDFGQGWRLLVPYQVAPVDNETQHFLNAVIPRRMKVTNLCSGEEEVLSFSADRYAAAGYVADKVETSQVIGLFIMSNGSFRLADKLGNQFHFDQGGRLTDMFFSTRPKDRVCIEYLRRSTDAFDRKPYRVEPLNGERIAFHNARIPRQVKVTDLLHGSSETLTFTDKKAMAGYAPDDEKASRFRFLALLSSGGLQLLDKHDNEIAFDSTWEFRKFLLPDDHHVVHSLAMGGRKVEFRYTIDNTGRVLIASAALAEDKPDAPPSHLVLYDHDAEGRLCRVQRFQSPEPWRDLPVRAECCRQRNLAEVRRGPVP